MHPLVTLVTNDSLRVRSLLVAIIDVANAPLGIVLQRLCLDAVVHCADQLQGTTTNPQQHTQGVNTCQHSSLAVQGGRQAKVTELRQQAKDAVLMCKQGTDLVAK